MNLYFELLKKPVFNMEYVNLYCNNIETSRSAVKRLMSGGMVAKIRNNMYTCINGQSGVPIANRYQIASHITSTSYISHHTAMEYYGVANQVFHEVYVSSCSSFREFEFDGYKYSFLQSPTHTGVEYPAYSGDIAVTSLERTLVDSIYLMDKIAGMEETIENIRGISILDEKKILEILQIYSNQFLYQKVGYILDFYKEQLDISEVFLEACHRHIGKSKRYITRYNSDGVYDRKWQLVVPRTLDIKNGVNDDDIL